MRSPEPLPTRPVVIDGRPARVLVTGAGGPAAVGFMQMVGVDAAEWFAADIDPDAAGLYLVDRPHRLMVERGDDPSFADHLLALCVRHRVDVLVPTVDVELPVIAAVIDRFTDAGIRVLMSPKAALDVTLDKWALFLTCSGQARVPHTQLLDAQTLVAALDYPLVAKPRRGSGSTGVRIAQGPADLATLPLDGSFLLQELLPGDEFSVDVLVRSDGVIVAAVPRRRDKVDSGVAVAGRTVRDDALSTMAADIARATGVRGVANVQLRRDRDGVPALLEVNPRVPGTLTLTAAAGVDMARLALDDVLGQAVPDHVDFREVAVVRYLADLVVPVDDYRTSAATDDLPRRHDAA